jgi:hypothetical protein
LLLRNFDNAKRNLNSRLFVEGNFNSVVTSLREGKALEVHDEVTGEESSAFRELNMEVTVDWHVSLVKGFTFAVNDVDAELVIASVFRGQNDAESQSAGRMDSREAANEEGVKSTLYTELALIISCKVAKNGYLKVHNRK